MKNKRCVIIGASPNTDIGVIKSNVVKDDFIVCADGGYILAQKLGIRPDIIIGDFDSSDFPKYSDCEIISLPVMKDDTDTNFCVKECIKRGYTNFLFLGVTGGRADHTFANLCTMKLLADKNMNSKIVDFSGSIYIMNSGKKEFINKSGLRFSIFPFACESCVVTLEGFLYEIQQSTLRADFPIGVSNTITNNIAKVTVHSGCALIMVGQND